MRERFVAMAGLGLILAYVVSRQGPQIEEGTILMPTGTAQFGDRSAPAPAPLQPRQFIPAEPVRGRPGTLPSPRGTDADPDPLAALADAEAEEAPVEVEPLLDAGDDLMAWALEPTDAPVESAPVLDAEDDVLWAMEVDDQPPIEVGPPIDADDPDAADSPPDEGAPIEVGPDLDADDESKEDRLG